MAVYTVTDDQGAVFVDARLDLVSWLQDFRETLLRKGIIPNISDAYDDHQVVGAIHPYATVGLVRTTFENEGAGNETYDMHTKMVAQVFLHFAQGIAVFDQRLKWDLLNSLYNFSKNTHRISANFDGLWILSMEGEAFFPDTQTSGAVFNLELWRIVST